jgi:hypothetical protein
MVKFVNGESVLANDRKESKSVSSGRMSWKREIEMERSNIIQQKHDRMEIFSHKRLDSSRYIVPKFN